MKDQEFIHEFECVREKWTRSNDFCNNCFLDERGNRDIVGFLLTSLGFSDEQLLLKCNLGELKIKELTPRLKETIGWMLEKNTNDWGYKDNDLFMHLADINDSSKKESTEKLITDFLANHKIKVTFVNNQKMSFDDETLPDTIILGYD